MITGTFLLSCLVPGPHVRDEHQAAMIQHRAVALRAFRRAFGQVRELAQMEPSDALVTVRGVIVGGAVVAFAHVEERIIERRKDRGPEAARPRGSCRSESASAMMSHIRRVCSRKSSGKPLSGRFIVNSGRPLSAGPLLGLVLVGAHPLDALFDVAHAGQIFVQLRLVGRTDLAAQLLGAVPSRGPAR